MSSARMAAPMQPPQHGSNSNSSGSVPLHLASDIAARVRAAALQEAARRLKEREAQKASNPGADDLNGAAGSSRRRSLADTTALTDCEEDEPTAAGAAPGESLSLEGSAQRAERLLTALQDEKARNDAEWATLQRELAVLGKRASGISDAQDSETQRQIRDKEIQLAQIEFHIQQMDEKRADVGPNTSALVRDVLARGNLSDVISQLRHALADSEAALARARDAHKRERQLKADLALVEQGMLARQAQLERRSTQLTEDELIEQIKGKLRAEEEQLGELLNALIRTSNDLFSDDDARLRVQLRSFLDALMNRAWDMPADPYVSIDKHPKSLASFLVRAHVAQEHPRDSRRLRLVPFQKGVRS